MAVDQKHDGVQQNHDRLEQSSFKDIYTVVKTINPLPCVNI